MGPHHESGEGEIARPPKTADLTRICSELNKTGAKYVVVGGFAVIQHGLPRLTNDIDLLIETSFANEQKVLDALMHLPEKAAGLVKAGEVEQYGVVRVGDEVVIDLMKSGCGVTYAEAIKDAYTISIGGIEIPFASPLTLWNMKQTVREKDIPDRLFLKELLSSQGIEVGPKGSENAPDHPVARWLRRVSGRGRS